MRCFSVFDTKANVFGVPFFALTVGVASRSAALESLWPYGFSTIGDVTFESAAYVARYVLKKVTGSDAQDHYRAVSPSMSPCHVNLVLLTTGFVVTHLISILMILLLFVAVLNVNRLDIMIICMIILLNRLLYLMLSLNH